MPKFPHYHQTETKDCGPTCLKIISKFYGKNIPIQELREMSETTREGSNLLGLSECAEKLGYRSLGVQISFENLETVPLPCIVHWNQNHYVVLHKIEKSKNTIFNKQKDTILHVSDPAHGLVTFTKEEFITSWIRKDAHEKEEGVLLLLDPSPEFYNSSFDEDKASFSFKHISKYLIKYNKYIIQLAIGLMAGSLLQLALPFLTQSVVDVGIQNRDLNFIYLILFAQLAFFIGRTSIEIIRSWILLHLSTRINISLISDFFIKLMKLPFSFFDAKMTGDLMQRIHDHQRIERMLTTSSLEVLFSMINFVIFSFILAYYNLSIFMIFLSGSILYFTWVLFFFKKRKELDYKRFNQSSLEQSKVIEIIHGMQEIKLHNAEKHMRWSWEFQQIRLFKISIKGLSLNQIQNLGSSFINELKNIFITVFSATLVIEGELTLGMMLAINTIVGQLNAPVMQMIGFMREAQDAKISLDRLAEIHDKDDEEPPNKPTVKEIPTDEDITIEDLEFKYPGAVNPVLHGLNLTIPKNKVTAIVGTSGSGKTTLMKLLLGFYQTQDESIQVGDFNINHLSQRNWRSLCGTVMQEGFIFNDTIAKNIAVGIDSIDKERLKHAINVANIQDYIKELPQGVHTKLGDEGIGLSTGQKQRLLIARAVYKDPSYLFLDEATSALDANNEKAIMENLNQFFEDRTVLIIAHRLSTVKNADQIVVLDKGKIAETGSHDDLVEKKGDYYHLVKNQLELGN
ncbi:peptidase domain-containing ABC transporter [Aureibacter tunicatorum]|uniref:ATP-binding cassette subfamily B protein n=1 Tax=Aureibacter tunicatorum TaxID=866807 RepID=A0AAE3XT62_9BACT|nr:peptidase domain-containing ABC transporter [Aureibacter tunicatorum]MDR6241411.1 ATP-binding cassette subfamily B protein [Aureibacter tunicatorum]BDD06744.1 ABC transporter ATP-binding protein [Aureibacter tunicatorum]